MWTLMVAVWLPQGRLMCPGLTRVTVMSSFPVEALSRPVFLFIDSSTYRQPEQTRELHTLLPKRGTSWEKGENRMESLNITINTKDT
jgi:hypothetical protein